MKTLIPPIKSQGIKTKLVPWIRSVIPENFSGVWIEPFMGTGVVAFNIAPKRAVLCDTNPHLINFYNAVKSQDITAASARLYLEAEGKALLNRGGEHYYYIRDRFNAHHRPLDFLFLNRAGFNGMIRFNSRGQFNIPFCHKPGRFSKAYVTKIVNQIDWVSSLLKVKDFSFKTQSFGETIERAGREDIVYCDPPYIGRHVDYFNGWDDSCERALFSSLSRSSAKFILSTWHHNDYRKNEYVHSLWDKFDIITKRHHYHIGGFERNRNPVTEALIVNFEASNIKQRKAGRQTSFLHA